MLDSEAVFAKLKSILADELGIDPDEIKLDSTLEDLGADSLSLVALVMAIDEIWDVDIPDEDAEQLKTVGDAVNYIVAHAK